MSQEKLWGSTGAVDPSLSVWPLPRDGEQLFSQLQNLLFDALGTSQAGAAQLAVIATGDEGPGTSSVYGRYIYI